MGAALRGFTNEVDLMRTSLFTYCKSIVGKVIAAGRTNAEEKNLNGELPLLKNQIGREI